MPFEIDFLPSETDGEIGDAIALRYGLTSNQKIIVYDAGDSQHAHKLVKHIQHFFNTDRVEHLVCSHPDSHSTPGLVVVLEHMQVGTLWLHQPWLYCREMADYFATNECHEPGLGQTFEAKFRTSYELAKLANQKGVAIKEPFQGQLIGHFHVLSPSKEWYVNELVSQFKQPISSPNHLMRFLRCLRKTAKRAVSWVAEKWETEYLPETGHTSAENESSVVLYGNLEDYHYGLLLTGHAGVEALHRAIDYLELLNINAPKHIQFMQVPHHGALEHVSSVLLNRLVGAPLEQEPVIKHKVAFISTPTGESSYPHASVVNALLRRGVKVVATEGKIKRHHKNTQTTADWRVAQPLSFSEQVKLESS